MVDSQTHPISRQVFEELKAATEQSGRPMQELVNEAMEQFRTENE
jgi:hypothetical protein